MRSPPVKAEPGEEQCETITLRHPGSVIASIRHTLLQEESAKDLVVVCGDGVSISTSRLLLAAISPWLRCLMEEAGEEFCLCLPSITGRQLDNFLNTCLAEKIGEEIFLNRHTHEFISQLLNPKEWEKNRHKEIQFSLRQPVVNLKALENALIKQYYSKQGKIETYEEWEDVKEEIDSDYDEIEDSIPVLNMSANELQKMEICPLKGSKNKKLKKGNDNSDHNIIVKRNNIDSIDNMSKEQKNSSLTETLLSDKTRQNPEKNPAKDRNDGTPPITTKKKPGGQKGPRKLDLVKLCPECGQEFKRNISSFQPFAEYKKHLMKHKVQNFSCECADAPKLAPVDKLLMASGKQRHKENTIRLIKRHMQLVHMGWVACSQCEKIFRNEVLLSTHLKKHGQSIVCEKCGFEADTSGKMRYHKRNYHDNNTAVCDVCSKTFKNMARLKDHINGCHNEQECKICGKTVKQIHHHIQIMHQLDSEKMFQCPDCEKAFTNKGKLAGHRMNVHIKSQPHRCRYGCDVGYNDRSNRNTHEKKQHGALHWSSTVNTKETNVHLDLKPTSD